MLKRALTTVVGLPVIIFLIYYGRLPLVALIAVIAVLGLRELYIALSGKNMPIHAVGYLFTVGYFAVIYLLELWYAQFILLVLFMIVMQACMVFFFKKAALKDCIAVAYGFFYIPFLLAFIIIVRESTLGQFYVWLIFTSAFGCDTFAYLTGVTIGKHKLTGTPSPNKSVEGLIGGIIGAAVAGLVYGFFVTRFSGQFDGPGFIVQAAVISAVGAVFCVIGDMSASAIKRNTGIKDFGNLFPGHGGVMDRIDSVVLAAPFVFIAITWLERIYAI